MSALESRVQKKIEMRGMRKKICAKRDRFEKLAEIIELSSKGRFREQFLAHLEKSQRIYAHHPITVKDSLLSLYDAAKEE